MVQKMQKRSAGRKKFQETRHPIYKGVRERNGKWVCELRKPNKKNRIWLGTFSNPDMAAIAYDVAALAFNKGDTASLNFPNAATSLPRLNSRTCSIRSIQLAAMQAAEKHFSCGGDFKPDIEANNGSSESESSEESLDCELMMFSEDSRRFYCDEEEVFNMPGLINSMAEGLMITPPALERGFNWFGEETFVDLTLW